MAWGVSSWFKAECAKSFPEVARKIHVAYLKDVSDNGYDAVGFGSPIFVNGTVARQAVRFDGVSNYFAITGLNYQSSSLDHAITVEARISVTSAQTSEAGNNGALIAAFDSSEYWRLGVGSEVNSHGKFSFNMTIQGVTTDLSGNTDVNDGQMHFLTARYDPSVNGGKVTLFIDGSSDFSVNSLGVIWGSGLRRFGFLGDGSEAEIFNGARNIDHKTGFDLEEFRVWHVARTDAEINSYHDTTSLDTTSGLQIHYNFENFGEMSSRVMRWPRLRQHWSDIRPQSARVVLNNADGGMNELFTTPQAGLTTFALQFGLTHPDSGDELISPFVGRLGNVSNVDGDLSVAIDDKVSELSDVVIGELGNPDTYTNSSLPSDLVWDWLTNVGPFSSIQSASNPDIDYASFSDWASIFSSDTVEMNGSVNGKKITEALRKMARYTQSAIYMEGGKMRFNRFTAVNTETTNIGPGQVVAPSRAVVDMLELITKQTVLGGYNVNSEQWSIQAISIDSESSVSYGLRASIERDENIWYTTSVSALNLAQRFTLIGGNPYQQIFTKTNLAPLPRQVGETINFTDDQSQLFRGYRIMAMEFDMNDGTFDLEINASQTETPFVLDQSALDGPDKLL